ncbi:hypothetical protein MLD38_012569 [Melastoma candidum]|uniref:Uncharacterized protein n=1 Tax=Melastoma candidum TaxID=119954 RepID=A0ACB9R6R7_9MYRT|nr:hypothetical protein MLD38_012569 [Melastoma candidum]
MATDPDQKLQQRPPSVSIWNIISDNRPTTPQLVALLALVPLGAALLLFAGLTFAATFAGLVIAMPLLLLFSPIIMPAVATIALAVLGILTSEALGVMGLASVLWLANYLREVRPWHRAAAYLGHWADDLGLKVEHGGKAQEVAKADEADRT